MIQQTSLDSFVQLKLEGKLGKRQQQVLTYIGAHPRCTDREVSQGVGLPINSVTGRRNELAKQGYIKEDGRKYDATTDREVLAWMVI